MTVLPLFIDESNNTDSLKNMFDCRVRQNIHGINNRTFKISLSNGNRNFRTSGKGEPEHKKEIRFRETLNRIDKTLFFLGRFTSRQIG